MFFWDGHGKTSTEFTRLECRGLQTARCVAFHAHNYRSEPIATASRGSCEKAARSMEWRGPTN